MGTRCGRCSAVLDALESFDADVVLTDESMPGMTGMALLRDLRRRGFAKPVILMTGFGADTYEHKGEDGVVPDAVLGKPITLETLRAALAEVRTT